MKLFLATLAALLLHTGSAAAAPGDQISLMLEVTLAYDLPGETKASRSWETQVRLTEGETSTLDVSLAEGPPQTLLITGSRDEDTANLEFELKRGEGQAEQTLAKPALAVGEAKKASVKITEIRHYESLEIAATPFWKTGAD